jgi:hypothetical protein
MMAMASLWPRGWNFGPVMISAGVLCIVHFAWRYRNPEWPQDYFWSRHPRLRDWLRFDWWMPRFVARRLTTRRSERATAFVGVAWGLGGIAIGTAQLIGAFPG